VEITTTTTTKPLISGKYSTEKNPLLGNLEEYISQSSSSNYLKTSIKITVQLLRTIDPVNRAHFLCVN
jgi:hypothetical protein